ncbi:hypothetical protein BZA77DRAFT_344455 [Pyronema omphalodes]|nr:hypothetical protein BZA77DRAFT_344455 [Pyronema omphalodes]
MASEQPNHQGSDDAKSLPKRRTYRLSEIPPDITRSKLCEFLDSLQAGTGLTEGNSKVFSLATYGSWQVATVSFDTIPDECETCVPGRQVHLRLSKRQVNGRAISISVTIDCDFYSMTPLYEPADTTARYDIIAVTGLSAHAFGSWRSPDKADRMWLRDFLPRDFPDIRVITWGYYSSILDARSTTSIAAISRDFLEDVKQVRAKEVTVHRIFLCLLIVHHDILGGLVLQKALVDASKSNSEEEKAFHQSNEHFLRDLGTGSDYLFELQKDFGICHESMNNCTIVSFYESKDTRTVETFPNGEAKRSGTPIRMVPRQSAVCPVSKPHNIFQICADHSKMVKFQSHSDEHYLRVVTKIKEITESYGILGVRQGLKGGCAEIVERFIS